MITKYGKNEVNIFRMHCTFIHTVRLQSKLTPTHEDRQTFIHGCNYAQYFSEHVSNFRSCFFSGIIGHVNSFFVVFFCSGQSKPLTEVRAYLECVPLCFRSCFWAPLCSWLWTVPGAWWMESDWPLVRRSACWIFVAPILLFILWIVGQFKLWLHLVLYFHDNSKPLKSFHYWYT